MNAQWRRGHITDGRRVHESLTYPYPIPSLTWHSGLIPGTLAKDEEAKRKLFAIFWPVECMRDLFFPPCLPWSSYGEWQPEAMEGTGGLLRLGSAQGLQPCRHLGPRNYTQKNITDYLRSWEAGVRLFGEVRYFKASGWGAGKAHTQRDTFPDKTEKNLSLHSRLTLRVRGSLIFKGLPQHSAKTGKDNCFFPVQFFKMIARHSKSKKLKNVLKSKE